MSSVIRVAAGQINTTVGDFEGNERRIVEGIEYSRELRADLVAFPELSICGYPPEDLVITPSFVRDNLATLKRVVQATKGLVTVVGFVDDDEETLGNAAAVIVDGEMVAIYRKALLPNYGVFDEKRYFTPGFECPVFRLRGISVTATVCEDIWEPSGPMEAHRRHKTELIININASPYRTGIFDERESTLKSRAEHNQAFFLYVNQVGGQDELVFDGGSMAVSPDGNVILELPQFEESTAAVDMDISLLKSVRKTRMKRYRGIRPSPMGCRIVKISSPDIPTVNSLPALKHYSQTHPSNLEATRKALVLGLKDYVYKTNFDYVAIALSGGIDSSLVACLAEEALGADKVLGIAMPSRYSSQSSVEDARALTKNLNIPLWELAIEPAHSAFQSILEPKFGIDEEIVDSTEENIQARVRGTLMMAISNKYNRLILTTGNKSEMATGYATLYGDMAGGFAVIKDVPKTMVYDLCNLINREAGSPVIPFSVIEKPPSAELRPNQTDQDSLPPYDILDRILYSYIEERISIEEIVERERQQGGADPETVVKVARLVDNSEYKRRQAPPGIKITSLSFGRDRRLPIASAYRPKWNRYDRKT